MTHKTAVDIERAKRHRAVHALLAEAKRAGWSITRIEATGAWHVTHPSGGSFVVSPRPTVRAMMSAEAAMRRIEREGGG